MSPVGENVVAALQTVLLDMHKLAIKFPYDFHGQGNENYSAATRALIENTENAVRIPMQVKVGDTVLFSRNAAQEFSFEGDRLLVSREGAILGILDSEDL